MVHSRIAARGKGMVRGRASGSVTLMPESIVLRIAHGRSLRRHRAHGAWPSVALVLHARASFMAKRRGRELCPRIVHGRTLCSCIVHGYASCPCIFHGRARARASFIAVHHAHASCRAWFMAVHRAYASFMAEHRASASFMAVLVLMHRIMAKHRAHASFVAVLIPEHHAMHCSWSSRRPASCPFIVHVRALWS
ncbi:hypothetical protein NL676_029944 [Syzygium grande]|nr:hypothetical protein NL676_029944 [Syzygium grande]